MAPSPLIRRTIDVVLGDPEPGSRSSEAPFDAQNVAAVCRVDGTVVKVEISTLDLAEKDLEANMEAWIAKATTDVAATFQWQANS